ncbi:hypothetical protein EPS74_02035 [Escherichia coli]|nr:hypothetical protein EPS74_02035 [Escherichia coli]
MLPKSTPTRSLPSPTNRTKLLATTINVATIHIAPRILNAEKINSTTIYSPPNKKACDYQQACY